MSDSKYSTKPSLRRRRAYASIVNHFKNNNFASITKESLRFNDHYRHHLEQSSKRQKRFLSKVNNRNRRNQFIRYVQCSCNTHIYLYIHYTFSHIDIHHRAIYRNNNTTNLFWFDFWYFLNWFMHEMNRKRKKQDAHHYFHVWLKWRSSNISAAKWNQTFSM